MPFALIFSASDHDRFWSKVDTSGECWIWTAAQYPPGGYGHFAIDHNVQVPAHRVAYVLCRGPISDGHQIHHICNEPRCANPEHLEALTPEEHAARHQKAHCKNGHEYTLETTRRGSRQRHCRICDRRYTQEYLERKRRGIPTVPKGERTHCPHGHEYTEENTYRPPSGGRRCRQCARDRDADRRKAMAI